MTTPVTRPSNLQLPFANGGTKNIIPVPSQIGIVNGQASYTDGFPPLTMTPLAAGGTPPLGQDFNGILNAMSAHTVFQNAGGRYRFDATLAAAIGGYPVGFVLQSDDGLSEYVNILANNSTNFNSTPAAIGVSWMPYAGGMSASIGANGWRKNADGSIDQWGTFTLNFNAAPQTVSQLITYPIAFTVGAYVVNITSLTSTPATYPSPGVVLTSPSQFTAHAYGASNNASQSYYWQATGK